MTVVDGEDVYRVWWDHRHAPDTRCAIRRGRADFTHADWDASPRFDGVALLNPKDHYNRNKGRKIALTRAIEQMDNGEGCYCDDGHRRRVLFWAAYREQLGHW